MPAYDQCHDQVVRAFQTDGWQIVAQHVTLVAGKRKVHVDLRVQRGSNGTSEEMFLVEVKCFPERASWSDEIYGAIGQYLIYRAMLDTLGQETVSLYLSIPLSIYTEFFDEVVKLAIQKHNIQMVVVDLITERIDRWIRS
jgi:hypothetical protein